MIRSDRRYEIPGKMRPVIKRETVEKVENFIRKQFSGERVLIKGLSGYSYDRMAHGVTIDELLNYLIDKFKECKAQNFELEKQLDEKIKECGGK
jgi:hypothetical protein